MSLMTDTPKTVDEFERRILAASTAWTAFVRVSPFDRRRIEATTKEEAVRGGAWLSERTGKRALIYGITPQGRSVMAGSVGPDGVLESAIREPA
jgi:hypothetical protein